MYELITLSASACALVFASLLSFYVTKQASGTRRMREIAEAIREGSSAYMVRQYRIIAVIGAVLALVLALTLGYFVAFTFLLGAIFSALAGYTGLRVSTRANVRTAQATRTSLERALKIAFRSGMVTGMCVTGLGLLGLAALYFYTGDVASVVGFSFGGALIALFMRVGGGIYTKAADMGADLVGKVEVGIPEDDPRNPAVIADQVGDNVGDVAGMGADLFESYVCAMIAAMLIGVAHGTSGIVFPLLVGAAGIFASIVGTFFVGGKNVERALLKGVMVSGTLTIISAYVFAYFLLNLNVFYATLSGIAAGILFTLITKYYTLYGHQPTRLIARAAQTGPATNVLTGFAFGLQSTALPVAVVCGAIFLAYASAGVYGASLTAVGMVTIAPFIIAMDSYGPVVDNASGISEMAGLGAKARKVGDVLDSAGNTTKAICKGFAIGAAALAALAMFSAYAEVTGTLDVLQSSVFVGLFIGAMLSFLFCSFLIQAVSNAAFRMIEEVRRQFRQIPGLREGKAKPDYATCVGISTNAALKGLILPGLVSVATPIVVGFVLGAQAVGGLLAGNIASALPLALLLAHTGTAWDNAKKFIEAGNLGGKGSATHKSAVIGDTIGDPFKDTAGPSLDILMDVMAIVAILFVQQFIAYALL